MMDHRPPRPQNLELPTPKVVYLDDSTGLLHRSSDLLVDPQISLFSKHAQPTAFIEALLISNCNDEQVKLSSLDVNGNL